MLLGTTIACPVQASNSPYLLGDWNGERTHLSDQGIDFNFGYTSELAHNFNGGTRHLTRYTDQWNFGATFDLDKLWGWKGSRFQIMVSERNGRNLTADAHLPVYQQVQEVYGRGQTWHLTIFAFNQRFFGDKLEWSIGRLPVGSDFDSFSCDFQNLTFCGSPPGNIAGDYWINWPTSQWATWLKWNTTEQTYIKLGAYQLNPKYIDNDWARTNGWKLNFPGGTTGALIPLEFGWTPSVNGLPGSYKVGGWYNNAGGSDLYYDINRQPIAITGEAPLQDSSRYGGYLGFQQQISGIAGGNGVTVFANATMTDAQTSPTDRQFAIGAEYKGPFNRDNDMIGFAVGATHGSSRLAAYQRLYNQLNPNNPVPVQSGYEYAAELFYSWSPIPSIQLRPNLQYVAHPGGTSQNGHVFVLGLKSIIAF
ncbi:porin [Dyella sp. M7H15-1]|uniref:carbohydrate porin n=1 Tax=Dyella sp. M7H15-1 TaxID=2501295 RepID=UPI001004FD1E|nr:carbohydrate porin [Dyella sp. M7H15-1]QAU24451.1 porin [Dyella sp. M7H15-1]